MRMGSLSSPCSTVDACVRQCLCVQETLATHIHVGLVRQCHSGWRVTCATKIAEDIGNTVGVNLQHWHYYLSVYLVLYLASVVFYNENFVPHSVTNEVVSHSFSCSHGFDDRHRF